MKVRSGQWTIGTGFLILILSSLSISGCSYVVDKNSAQPGEDLTPAQKASLSYSDVRDQVIGPRCVTCHGISGGVNLETYESLKANMIAVERAVFVSKTMPKGGALSVREANILKAWIENGGPREGASAGGPKPSPTPGGSPLPSPTPTAPIKPEELSFDFVSREVFGPKCVTCHNSTSAINLQSYDVVKARMPDIMRAVLLEKTMPKNGALSKREFDVLLAWISAGAPKDSVSGGDPSQKPTPTPEPKPLEPTFDSIKANIFMARCVLCHSAGGEAKNVPLSTKEDLLDSPRELVIPGNLDESGLIIAIERQDNKRMPPPSTGGSLSEVEIKTIRDWIANGAKD